MKKYLGQSLFEIVIALGVVALVVVAIVSLSTKGNRNSNFTKSQNSATRYTQEAVEWIRNQRDLGWSNFALKSSSEGIQYCLAILSWNYPGWCTDQSQELEGIFLRVVTLKSIDANTIQADVKTLWNDTVYHEVRTITYFTNWLAPAVSCSSGKKALGASCQNKLECCEGLDCRSIGPGGGKTCQIQ